MAIFQPNDAKEVAAILTQASQDSTTVEIVSGGSKRGLGRPVYAEHHLNLSRLTGVMDYDPPELVLTVRAATSLREVESLLASSAQMLAFEPADYRGLLGTTAEPTIGGALACNLSGPRRVRAGAARDYLLGFEAVNGRGEIWKAGGKVVKNVTGFDLCKLMAGSYGTLSAITELTLKVMPKPETCQTLILSALSDETAIRNLARALNSPHEVSGAAHLPANVAKRSHLTDIAIVSGAATAIRVEGPAPSVAFRIEALETLLGAGVRLFDQDSRCFWSKVGSAHSLLPSGDRFVWKLHPPPSMAPALTRAILERFPSAAFFYDWGGGLVWLSLPAEVAGANAGSDDVRQIQKRFGGHCMLIAAPEAVRETVSVFEPEPPSLSRLNQRVKHGFDPRRILNPGRLHEGQ